MVSYKRIATGKFNGAVSSKALKSERIAVNNLSMWLAKFDNN